MKKDIEWLNKEIATEMIELGPNRKERWSDVKYQTLRSVAEKIYQLDEPEVLSQEWIDDKTFVVTDSDGDDYAVVGHASLKNLIIPKQESQVLSQENINLVLDDLKEYIKEQQSLSQNVGLAHTSAGNDTHYRQYGYVLECIDEYEPSDELQNLLVPKQEELETKILELIESYKQEEDVYSNPENGWISGFIEDLKNLVEEEQKYYVSERDEEYGGFWFLSKKNNGNISIGVSRDWSEVDWDRLKLTEQEIKDYDERYWAFAKPVEELEE